VLPSDTKTLALLSGHAGLMNNLISPEIISFGNHPSGDFNLNWSHVVGSPMFEVHESDDLSNWSVIGRVTTNAFTVTGAAGARFYRIRPYWP
jgi:hypothetical protein